MDIDMDIQINTDIDIHMDRYHGVVIKSLCGHVTGFYSSSITGFLNYSIADTWGQICRGKLPYSQQGVYHHPWPLSTRYQLHLFPRCDDQNYLQTSTNVPRVAKSPQVENDALQ